VDIRDLEYLSCLADTGNFGRAAKSLGLNASTISRRVSRLEDELGVSLFDRGRAGTKLTAGGKCIMMHVRRPAPFVIGGTRFMHNSGAIRAAGSNAHAWSYLRMDGDADSQRLMDVTASGHRTT
jgi:regulatory helix-turn-helix LysR family protein